MGFPVIGTTANAPEFDDGYTAVSLALAITKFGSVVSHNVEICDQCIIGAGAVVVKNIGSRGTYVGVPVRKMK